MCIVQEYIHIFYQCVADRNLKPTHIENLLKYYWRYVRVCVCQLAKYTIVVYFNKSCVSLLVKDFSLIY